MSIPEKLLTCTVRTRAYIIKLISHAGRESAQRACKGQVIAYPQENALLHLRDPDILPRPLTSLPSHLMILFTGNKEPTEEQLKKIFPVRSKIIRNVLEEWRANKHPAYQMGSWSEPAFQEIEAASSKNISDMLRPCIQTTSEAEQEYIQKTTDSLSNSEGYNDIAGPAESEFSNTDDVEILDDDPAENITIHHSAILNANDDNTSSADDAKNAAKILECDHGDVPVSTYSNPDFYHNTMPWLFPLGSGGAEIRTRPTKLSLQAWTEHCLNYHDDRFRRDPAFMFVLFKIIQTRERVTNTTFMFKSVVSSYAQNRINSFTAADLKLALRGLSYHDKEGKITQEDRIRLSPLLQDIQTIGKHTKGSIWERGAARAKMLGLVTKHGLPTYFLTLNPSDINNPLVAFWHQGSGTDFNLDNLTNIGRTYPATKERAMMVANDPLHAAQMFHISVKAFLEAVLGFEVRPATKAELEAIGETRVPRGKLLNSCIFTAVDGRGVRAFYGTVECQGRGSLHLHLLVWLAGVPNPDVFLARIKEAIELSIHKGGGECSFTGFPDLVSHKGVKVPPTTGASSDSDKQALKAHTVDPEVLKRALESKALKEPWTEDTFLRDVARYMESVISMSPPVFSAKEHLRPCMIRKPNGRFLGESPTYFDNGPSAPSVDQASEPGPNRPMWDGSSCTKCISNPPFYRRPRASSGYPEMKGCKCETDEFDDLDPVAWAYIVDVNQRRLDAYTASFSDVANQPPLPAVINITHKNICIEIFAPYRP